MNSEEKYIPELRESVGELKRMREKAGSLSHEHWPMYDEGLASFAKEFMSVTPCSEKAEYEHDGVKIFNQEQVARLFVDYIRTTLKSDSNHHLTALEIGGPGLKLFGEFPPHFFEKTFGVCLADTENPIDKEKNDTGHEIITGDIFSNDTYKKIKNAVGRNGLDFIISRMAGGLDETTHNPIIWAKIAKKWYELLADGGLMFVQYRFATGDKWISNTEVAKDVREKMMKEWVRFIQDNYGEAIEIQLGENQLRLLKKKGAPDKLPVLEYFDRSPIIEKNKK